MKFKLIIDCGNAAFEDDAGSEVAEILRRLATRVQLQHASGEPLSTIPLHDTNGNRVGEAKFTGR